MAKDWFAMPGFEGMRQTIFAQNATNLTEEEANTEADRRTKADKAAGNMNVLWFACEDPVVVMRRMRL